MEEKKRNAISNGLIKKWEDPNYRNKIEIKLKKIRENVDHSKAGKKSRLFENEIAKNIQADRIFLPQEVCDRIVVRNGKIIFIEIKHKGERLRPKQSEFQELAKENYEILYG
jgi:hypothetical protein